MEDLKFILKEHKNNLYKLFKLSWYDFIAPLRDTYLGAVWIVLGPLLQIGVYWFVFGLGIRGGKPVDGHPFLLWMLAGLIPWFYISSCITSGATSIYSKASVLTKMKFPTSIIPTYNTLTRLMTNIPMIFIMMVIYAFYGYKATPYYFQLIYYIFAATVLGISISLLTSALVMAVRDINRVISTVIRFLFYLTPILWTIDRLPNILQKIMIYNPILYVVNGFRDSLLYNRSILNNPKETAFFWIITIIFLLLGSKIHMRLRSRFSDFV